MKRGNPEGLSGEFDSALAGIRDGLADVEAGRFQSLAEAFADLRNELEADQGTVGQVE